MAFVILTLKLFTTFSCIFGVLLIPNFCTSVLWKPACGLTGQVRQLIPGTSTWVRSCRGLGLMWPPCLATPFHEISPSDVQWYADVDLAYIRRIASRHIWWNTCEKSLHELYPLFRRKLTKAILFWCELEHKVPGNLLWNVKRMFFFHKILRKKSVSRPVNRERDSRVRVHCQGAVGHLAARHFCWKRDSLPDDRVEARRLLSVLECKILENLPTSFHRG